MANTHEHNPELKTRLRERRTQHAAYVWQHALNRYQQLRNAGFVGVSINLSHLATPKRTAWTEAMHKMEQRLRVVA